MQATAETKAEEHSLPPAAENCAATHATPCASAGSDGAFDLSVFAFSPAASAALLGSRSTAKGSCEEGGQGSGENPESARARAAEILAGSLENAVRRSKGQHVKYWKECSKLLCFHAWLRAGMPVLCLSSAGYMLSKPDVYACLGTNPRRWALRGESDPMRYTALQQVLKDVRAKRVAIPAHAADLARATWRRSTGMLSWNRAWKLDVLPPGAARRCAIL